MSYDFLYFRASTSYVELRQEAENVLSQIYSNNTVHEWLTDKIDDRIADAQVQRNVIERAQTLFDTR